MTMTEHRWNVFLTNLWHQGYSPPEWVISGAVFSTGVGTVFAGVSTFRGLLIWGACGVVVGALFGVRLGLRRTSWLRRVRDKARELLGCSATDAECEVVVRAAVRGRVPDDPRIRHAAALLAVDLLEFTPRGRWGGGVIGVVFLVMGLTDAATSGDLTFWFEVVMGWGMLLPHLASWRARWRVRRLRGKAEASPS